MRDTVPRIHVVLCSNLIGSLHHTRFCVAGLVALDQSASHLRPFDGFAGFAGFELVKAMIDLSLRYIYDINI